MTTPTSLPRLPEHLEAQLLRFDASWNNPDVEQLRAAYPSEGDEVYLLELIHIDAQKRVAAGMTAEEALYLEAFPVLLEKVELLQKVRAITFTPMQAGDSVLRALAATTPVLHQVNLPAIDPQATTSESPSALPEHRYKLEGEIARGGMGAVLRGRDEDLGREIAVKVMLQNHAGKTELLQRFVEEAQIAGQLQHPGITPVYELGRFPDQRPYFTMKLVRGQTLAKLLKDRADPASERPRFLKIFEQICQTLAYAHTRKVIHRDLKPHNIMVGSFGEVQVMDWGLAKVLTTPAESGAVSARPVDIPEASEGSVQTKRSSGNSTDIPNTQAGSVLGTPAYMAPEQARGDIDQLDERADVFGLGAILCEILTGKPPYVGESGFEIYRQAVDAVLGNALERLERCGADQELVSMAKRCLSVNREDRPRDASELTKNLANYLHSVEDRLKQAELTAVKATTKAEEESKRRRVTFQLATGILLTLLAGLAASLWQMNRAMVAEELAVQAADKEKTANELTAMRLEQIEKINNSVFDIFTEFDIRKLKLDKDPLEYVLAKRLIEMGKKLDAKAIHDPLVLANLQDRLGCTLQSLGRTPEAIEFCTSAREIRQAKLGPDHIDTLASMNNLAGCYQAAGKIDLALPLFEETLKLTKVKMGADHASTLTCMNNLAIGYQAAGKRDLALPLFEETLKLTKVKRGADHHETLASMNNLALGYEASGKLDLALPLFEETLKLAKVTLGADHPDTLSTMNNLAAGYQAQGRLNLALPLFEEALKLTKVKLGANHPDTLVGTGNLANIYRAAGKLDMALPLLEETLKHLKVKLGADHPDTLASMNNLAGSYLDTGKLDMALPLFEQTLKLVKVKLGADHPHTLISMNNLAAVYQDAGKLDMAVQLFKEVLARSRKAHSKDSPQLAGPLVMLGSSLLQAKAFAEAEPLLRECLAIREKTQSIVWTTFNTQSLLGGALLGQKKYAEAEPLLLKGYEGMKAREKTIPPVGSPRIPEALDRLIELYTATNKPDEVKKWQAERAKYPMPKEVAPKPTEKKENPIRVAQSMLADGKAAEAIRMLEKEYQELKEKLGQTHPDTHHAKIALGKAHLGRGDLTIASAMFEEVLKDMSSIFPERSNKDALVYDLARAYHTAGKVQIAVPLFEEAARLRTTKLGPDHPDTLIILRELGSSYRQIGKLDLAEPLLAETAKKMAVKLGPDHPDTLQSKLELAKFLLATKKYMVAEPLLLEVYERTKPVGKSLENKGLDKLNGLQQQEEPFRPQENARLIETVNSLIELYTTTNKPEEVKKWQAEKNKISKTPEKK